MDELKFELLISVDDNITKLQVSMSLRTLRINSLVNFIRKN